ncbi:hypothetical protein HPB50_019702 [Hyalomma asiaticum]|uniref:Uncharacterized protein n=1 Tax=Hyalomma asiaticum TaxID=266040 RepID=A0ACB7SA75_HYAAI|nr:hypothetical protein HPB50_019702 [Hyalomma asiaticum]
MRLKDSEKHGEKNPSMKASSGESAPHRSAQAPAEGRAARLENEDSGLTPVYRTGDRNGDAPPRRDEKDYEPVDVGGQEPDVGGGDGQCVKGGLHGVDRLKKAVRATYKYTAEDVDELNFESGEIIRVIEYDDPEEQEEGWLMGIKESTGEKGLFPANFTRPI